MTPSAARFSPNLLTREAEKNLRNQARRAIARGEVPLWVRLLDEVDRLRGAYRESVERCLRAETALLEIRIAERKAGRSDA